MIGIAGVPRSSVRVLNVNTTAVATVGSGEDTLMSYTLPGSTLERTGDAVRVFVWGDYAADDDSKVIKFHFGGTTAFSRTAADNGLNWWGEMIVVRTGAATQSAWSNYFHTNGAVAGNESDPTETLSGDVVIKVTGENATDTTNGSVNQRGMIVELLRVP